MVVPKKSLGQHFLVDPSICTQLIRAGRFAGDDLLLEVGPGKGALTGPLLAEARQVIAVELDRDLVQDLVAKFHLHRDVNASVPWPVFRGGNLVLVEADIRQVQLAALAVFLPRSGRVRVLGNLPYNQATAILHDLLEQRADIEDLTLMFQREVADRLLARPGQRDYGYLSVITQFYCRVEKCFQVPPDAFRPRPQVQSTVVQLTPMRPDRLPPDEQDRFRRVVSASFLAKRKTLLNNLRGLFPHRPPSGIEERCTEIGIDPRRRAETLSVEEFIALSAHLTRGLTP